MRDRLLLPFPYSSSGCGYLEETGVWAESGLICTLMETRGKLGLYPLHAQTHKAKLWVHQKLLGHSCGNSAQAACLCCCKHTPGFSTAARSRYHRRTEAFCVWVYVCDLTYEHRGMRGSGYAPRPQRKQTESYAGQKFKCFPNSASTRAHPGFLQLQLSEKVENKEL